MNELLDLKYASIRSIFSAGKIHFPTKKIYERVIQRKTSLGQKERLKDFNRSRPFFSSSY